MLTTEIIDKEYSKWAENLLSTKRDELLAALATIDNLPAPVNVYWMLDGTGFHPLSAEGPRWIDQRKTRIMEFSPNEVHRALEKMELNARRYISDHIDLVKP